MSSGTHTRTLVAICAVLAMMLAASRVHAQSTTDTIVGQGAGYGSTTDGVDALCARFANNAGSFGVAVAADGTVYWSEWAGGIPGDGRVGRLSGGAVVWIAGGLNDPRGIELDSSGSLWVAGYYTGVYKITNPAGANPSTELAIDVVGVHQGLGIADVAIAANGDVYYTLEGSPAQVMRYDPVADAGTIGTLVYSDSSCQPKVIAFDGAGNLYHGCDAGMAVKRWDGATLSTVTSGLGRVFGIVYGGGYLYVSEQAMLGIDQRLSRIEISSGTRTTLNAAGAKDNWASYGPECGGAAVNLGTDGQTIENTRFVDPTGLAIDTLGCLYVADHGAQVIRKTRCPTYDFGDAPQSYGTTLGADGARHQLEPGGLRLGSTVDGEDDAAPSPLSDDKDGEDDEDGVELVTGLARGESALVRVSASGAGYLNAWVDWDGDGTFGAGEQVFQDRLVSTGENVLLLDVPGGAAVGATWARFRLSSSTGLGPLGAAPDGEVEDHAVTVGESTAVTTSYPSASGWVTLAYEDGWPRLGDYDFNDLVLHYRTTTVRKQGVVVRYRIEGEVTAVGAGYHNGIAVHLPGITRDQVDEVGCALTLNGALQASSPLEVGRAEAIVIVADDVWDHLTRQSGCSFYRTESGCAQSIQLGFAVDIPLLESPDPALEPAPPFDPFLFASPGVERSGFAVSPGRGLEIHLKNRAPTSAFDESLLGTGADRSDPAEQLYFLTDHGLPWALEVGTAWSHPLEREELRTAYSDFETFVDSGGLMATDWYLHPSLDHVFTD